MRQASTLHTQYSAVYRERPPRPYIMPPDMTKGLVDTPQDAAFALDHFRAAAGILRVLGLDVECCFPLSSGRKSRAAAVETAAPRGWGCRCRERGRR
eukprot:2598240-Rhodomonas_salina.1